MLYPFAVRFAAIALLLLAACGSSEGSVELSVDLLTDYVPGVEFALVRIEVEELSDEVPATDTAADRSAFIEGRRIFEDELSPGVRDLTVQLLRSDRSVVAIARQRVSVQENTSTVVVVSRSCRGLRCPGSADAPNATECIAGVCVPPECSLVNVEACPPGVFGRCEADADCASTLDCVTPRCVSGLCLGETNPATCAADETCDPERGCVGGSVPIDGGMEDAGWAFPDDPPVECFEDGSMGPPSPPIGGTLRCPADKNLEGCPCSTPGTRAPCWPDLRVHRGYGICEDGETVCGDDGLWSACEGAVLPSDPSGLGDDACRCFADGRWELDSVAVCFYPFPGEETVISSADGACEVRSTPPPPPSEPWATNRLRVDCEGAFQICYSVFAGDFDDPRPDDCRIARRCTDAWIEEAGVEQELPALGSWRSMDGPCVNRFIDDGGYGEMTVTGQSDRCDDIGTTEPYVFVRVKYCAPGCVPGTPGCEDCGLNASGSF